MIINTDIKKKHEDKNNLRHSQSRTQKGPFLNSFLVPAGTTCALVLTCVGTRGIVFFIKNTGRRLGAHALAGQSTHLPTGVSYAVVLFVDVIMPVAFPRLQGEEGDER